MWTYVLVFILVILYLYHKINITYSYWSRKGVKGPKPDFIFGNLKPVTWLGEHSVVTFAGKIHKEFMNEKVVGIYQGPTPTLVVRDPDLIKTVLVKDFSCFTSRGLGVSQKPIWSNIFFAERDIWKPLRKNLSPLFTMARVKTMMPELNECVGNYMMYLDKAVAGASPMDIRKLNIKYTIDSITSTTLGIKVDTYSKKTAFEDVASVIVQASRIRKFSYLLNNIAPGLITYLVYTLKHNYIIKFFVHLVKDITQQRTAKPCDRKDLMAKLIELKQQGKINEKYVMCDELMAAQIFIIYEGGSEASSELLNFLMFELAWHPSVQERCRMEVDVVMEKYHCVLDHDAVCKELPYLNMVMEEILRKYPVGALLTRKSDVDYTFNDIDLTIAKGTKLLISVLGLHNDPKYFPEPEKFDPERFSPENRHKYHDYYIPFGDGPRNCLGMRLVQMQCVLGIAHFIHKFQVSPCDKTPKKIKFDPDFITIASNDMWLNVEKRIKG